MDSQPAKAGLAGSQTACDASAHMMQVLGLENYTWFKDGKIMATIKIKIQNELWPHAH